MKVTVWLEPKRLHIIDTYRKQFLRFHKIQRRDHGIESDEQFLRVNILCRRKTRRFLNKDELLRTIVRSELITSAFKIEVKLVEFEDLTIADQIRVIAKSDVFFGMIGASTCGPITFLPPGAILIQIFSARHVDSDEMRKEGYIITQGAGAHFLSHKVSRVETVVRNRNDTMLDDIAMQSFWAELLIRRALCYISRMNGTWGSEKRIEACKRLDLHSGFAHTERSTKPAIPPLSRTSKRIKF
jgi:hypothetical protein